MFKNEIDKKLDRAILQKHIIEIIYLKLNCYKFILSRYLMP